ncbi:MAG: DNA-directed DNA polymerase [Candidatus Nanoarchaeia archaeon]
MKFNFYPTDITYKVVEDKTRVYLFGRTEEERQICVVDTAYQPFFVIIPQNAEKINGVVERVKAIRIENKNYSAVKAEVVKGSFNGRDVDAIRVFVNHPRARMAFKEELKGAEGIRAVLEADIPFKHKYWIDRGIVPLGKLEIEGEQVTDRMKVPTFSAKSIEKGDGDLKNIRTLALDIETYNPMGSAIIPEKFPIVMVSFYGDGFKKVITWKRFKTEHDYIEFVDGEGHLIERLKEHIEEYGPDAIVGYYSEGFDIPYIMKRAEIHKIKLDIGLDGSQPLLGRGNKKTADLVGITHIDVFNYVRQVRARLKSKSLKLGDVSSELLGETKTDVSIEKLAEVWDAGSDELDEYCVYNLKDSELTYRLLQTLLPNILELVKMTAQPLQAIQRMGYGQLVEWYLMRRSVEFRQFIPNKPHYREVEKRTRERTKGAFVQEPETGLHNDLFVYDFRSMYPTIIILHNISPETLTHHRDEAEQVPGLEMFFAKKKRGFFPAVLEGIVARRQRIKAILKSGEQPVLEAREMALKILANAFYGYLRFSQARWYSKECTKAITAYGRHYIKDVIGKAQAKGFHVVYADTDSVFMNKCSEKEIKEFVDEINYSLPELMELEEEGRYKTGLFTSTKEDHGAKKKYALLDEQDKMIIKGFEAVRSNWSLIARESQEEVLSLVLHNKVDAALLFAKKQILRLKNKEVKTSKVMIKTQLKKSLSSYESITPAVAVAKLMEARGENIYPGCTIRYVIVAGEGKIRDRAKTPDEVKEGEYDADYYLNNQLIPSLEKIFELFGYTREDLLEQKAQSKLQSFLG